MLVWPQVTDAADSVCLQRCSRVAGSLYSRVDSKLGHIGSVSFIENEATEKGGAIYLSGNVGVQARHATYSSNNAGLGGAIFVVLAEDQRTEFTTCLFEGNQATDGGAVYLYTGTGVDIFTDCVFRDNFASESQDGLDKIYMLSYRSERPSGVSLVL